MEPSLRQSEVTPRAMSQLSHLLRALWGQEVGPLSLPTWSFEASFYQLQPSFLPGNPVPLTEVGRGRKAGLSCSCQPRTLLERLVFWALAGVGQISEGLENGFWPFSQIALDTKKSPSFHIHHRDMGGGKIAWKN